MNEKDNGGPAFPSGMVKQSRPMHDPGADFVITDIINPKNGGMTLRDYFAAKAMQAGLSIPVKAEPYAFAKACYEMADAMLKVRNE